MRIDFFRRLNRGESEPLNILFRMPPTDLPEVGSVAAIVVKSGVSRYFVNLEIESVVGTTVQVSFYGTPLFFNLSTGREKGTGIVKSQWEEWLRDRWKVRLVAVVPKGQKLASLMIGQMNSSLLEGKTYM